MELSEKTLTINDNLSDVFFIRFKVFVQEQGVPSDIEQDTYDKDQSTNYILIYDKKKPIATGRLIYNGQDFFIGRVAVLEEYRRKNIGKNIINRLKGLALAKGASSIHLNSQYYCKGFYEKLGFQIKGNVFEEAGIRHVNMVYLKQSN